jgi:RND family efflux transporter MFP subunit
MRKALVCVLILFVGAAAFVAGFGWGRWYGPKPGAHAAEKKSGYHCPMHPTFRSDRPGDCGICGMKLVPDSAPAVQPDRPVLYYHDPKQPSYRSEKPGLNPETGNELVPVHAEAERSIHISAEKQSWIGVHIGTAAMHGFNSVIRASGRVAVDETRLTRVMSRTDGWVEQVTANFTGQLVNKGEPMLTLYSPELVASQQEYLLALKAVRELDKSEVPGMHSHTSSLVEAARARLERHWGMTPPEIVQLALNQAPQRTITIRAPETGFILERKAYPNQRITADTELYTLADLRKVWIVADVFESDAANIAEGMTATVEPSGGAAPRFAAKVVYLQPQVDPQTRTLKVRLEADNAGYRLRPDLFVNVEFRTGGGAKLSVPEDAVIDSGLHQTVFVAKDDSHFSPRRVQTGARAQGRVEILSGLRAGEKIAVSGAFLLDSETQLKAPAAGNHSHD